MRRDDLRHGTYAGWNAHRKEGKRPCAACRAAQAEYARERRQDPTIKKREYAKNKARSRALWRLARNHPEEFAALVEEELQ